MTTHAFSYEQLELAAYELLARLTAAAGDDETAAVAQADMPGKLAAFAYAFEHLETGAYEQLLWVAQAAGDDEAVAAAERILAQERAAAETVRSRFGAAVRASLAAVGAGTTS